MNYINDQKHDRFVGKLLLRSYLYNHASEQRNHFVKLDDTKNVKDWDLTVAKVLSAKTFDDLINLIQEVTAEEELEYVVLEALCSYRDPDYAHVERKIVGVHGVK